MENTTLIQQLIIGRVDPHIYAFSTGTIPNYLKVGDTYRPVMKRLEEWRRHFPDLEKRYVEKAKVNESTYFRDYAVHQYLETECGRVRLLRDNLTQDLYFSNEFFLGATEDDIALAISDIQQAYQNRLQKYTYYSFENGRIPINYVYERNENYEPRPNQVETIKRFKSALEKGRRSLLMYAVMRFGKSFTSMCCALEMGAKLVVVVSAKADVKTEWKRTVESHVKFVDYVFLDSDVLLQDECILNTTLQNKKAVVFLTLQDLMGEEIKTKHRSLFEREIDLLLVDESHYGARAEEYGRVLNLSKKKDLEAELKGLDTAEAYEQNLELKVLKSRVRIHLSGTPYRILMGSEFTEDDIIAFYQFSDIVEAQAQWDKEHLLSDDVKEWDNPYYGFPQMVRFAFLPNKSSRERLENLRKDGISSNLSELMRPQSISEDKKGQQHRKFIHETEILGLLQAIDGSEADEQILSLLGLEEIQQGKMCRHMVFVLPYRASCDAMEALLEAYKNAFNHLGDYAIINIAGLESERLYPTTESVKSQIEKYEQDNTKTITLTVNRMLTGSTVKEWDTMLYLKDSASPQEYDQAVFRLQNQYIRTLVSDNGESIKYNMKPQTLLVDFDPNRMFRLQEQRSQIYNANTEQRGNEELRRRIERELEYSPIVTVGCNGLQRVSPTDVMDAVRAYSANRSVMDEATDIPLDYSLLADETLRNAISQLNPIDASKGIEIKAVSGEGMELDFGDTSEDTPEQERPSDADNHQTFQQTEEEKTDNLIGKKLATYYAQILFYAFLTESPVDSLQAIIASIVGSEENKRIAEHVGLKVSLLRLVQQKSNVFSLRGLDYKIENLNSLMRDESLTPMKRVEVAMAKFGRLSSSEIVTPQSVALEMIHALGDEAITNETKILDIASKQGEFTRAFISKYGTEIGKNIYALPTSSVSYEFTRKVYSLLGLDTDLVISNFNAYELLKPEHKESLIQQLKDMNFDLVIGNPPYQQADGGAAASAKPIYQEFVTIAKEVSTTYTSIIMPARWYTGGKGLDEFRASMLTDKHIKLLYDYQRPDEVFPDTNNRGGLCFIVRDNNFDNTLTLPEVVSNRGNQDIVSQARSIKTDGLEMFIRHQEAISILEKVTGCSSFASLSDIVSARRPFGIDGNITRDTTMFKKQPTRKHTIVCYGRSSCLGYIAPSTVKSNSKWINKWKVFMPYANNIGTELNDDNLNAFVGQPNSVATETFLIVGADLSLDENSAQALVQYLKTRFARFMHSLSKASQHATSKTYRFVPLQDFTVQPDIDWNKSIDEIDQQLYAKYGLSEEEIAFIEGSIKEMK